MNQVRQVFQDAERTASTEAINKDFVDTFIDKVFVTPEEDGTLRLDIRIFTGDQTQKYLERLKSRTNLEDSTRHMFKKKNQKYAPKKHCKSEPD